METAPAPSASADRGALAPHLRAPLALGGVGPVVAIKDVIALGTDTGGSIRIPATCCGVAGLKPSFGRLSRRGLTPTESSLDRVGPLGRSVAAIIQAMAILDPTFVPAAAPERLRLGRVGCGASPPARSACNWSVR